MIARILVAASVIALVITGIATAQPRGAAHVHGKPSGIVHPTHRTSASSAGEVAGGGAAGPTVVDNLTYNGPDQSGNGPTMHTNKVFTMFWAPSGYTFPSNYKSTVNRFFQDVAADSGKGTNVYSVATQYFDTTDGQIRYLSKYGGTADDSHSFYASDCTTPSDVKGTKVCMSDDTLQKEVKRFANAQGWSHGSRVQIFLFTPQNVETCFESDAEANVDPADQACSYDYYCAYHNSFGSGTGEYIYANMPFPNQKLVYNGTTYSSVCVDDIAQGLPNSGGNGPGTNQAAADEVINVTSHEHNEAITDPTGDGWWVDNIASQYAGYENGDLCAWYFPNSAVLGGSGTTRYNQLINGHHYYVQGEWSNADATSSDNSGCLWAYTLVPTNTVAPTVVGAPVSGQTLVGHPGTWNNQGDTYAYSWNRCDTSGDNCRLIEKHTTTASTNDYVVRSADAGHTMKLIVTNRNAYGWSDPASSDPTAEVVRGVPANSAVPTITGTTSIGDTLTAHAGTWSNSPTSYMYNWLRCTSGGTGCTSFKTETTSSNTSTYDIESGDPGHTIKVRVKATNAAGDSAVAQSVLKNLPT